MTPASPPSDRRVLAVWALVLGLVSLLPPLALITGPVAVILGLVVLVKRRPGRGMAVVGSIVGALAWVALMAMLLLILMVPFLVFGLADLGPGVLGFDGGVTRQEAVGVYVQRSAFSTESLQLFEDGTYVQTAMVDNDPVPRTNSNRWRFRPRASLLRALAGIPQEASASSRRRGDVELTDAMVVVSPDDDQGRALQTWESVARPGWWKVRPGIQTLVGTRSLGRFGGRAELEQFGLEGVGLYYGKVSRARADGRKRDEASPTEEAG